MNNKPPIFKGRYDPDGAQQWLEGIKRIFGAFITWARFKREFLTKYFPADERNRK
ncbi:putative Ty3/Gypsy retrotransposon polyprotein, partial [Trifolium medium]|nr:putative Ty3/Gypsy retrotransposon polyprotein [Trifolium medium]